MDVRLPNGTVIRNVPEGTNKWAVAEKAIASGLATPEDFGQESANPAEGMGTLEKVQAGWGKSVYDLGRGVGQMVGLVDREDVQASRDRDAPLMETGAGKTGYVGGMVANTVPAAFIPGANTVGGATAIGAGLGLMQPSTSTGETAANIGIGGALGAGGLMAGRAIAAGYRGGRALLQPFSEGGQRKIAAETLRAFAGGADEAADAAQNIRQGLDTPMLPGVKPTAAELAKNPGIAQLERTIRNNPEYLSRMAGQTQGNRRAIVNELDEIAGDASRMDWTSRARSSVSGGLYDDALNVNVKPDEPLRKLLNRPSMRRAWTLAGELAEESGETIVQNGDSISGRALHFLKMAMDDIADNPQVHGIGGQQANAIKATRGDLVKWMGQNIDGYDLARDTYSAMSRPINQMQVGRALRDKFVPALSDFGAEVRGRPQAFAQALREGDRTAALALGRKQAKIDDVLNPLQTSRLKLIAEQLGRRANADELGRAAGSNTGQNIVSQNVIRQFLGPLGLPESTMQRAAESTLLQSVMRPVEFAGQLGGERAMSVLADAVSDPRVAEELLRIGVDPQKVGLLIRNQQYIAPALVSGANAARQ